MVTREIAIKTAESFVKDCSATGLNFYKVLLFGSMATGHAHEDSDIDLLLVSDKFDDNIFDNLKLYSRINIRYPLIETHPYAKEAYLAGDDFITEISKDSIVIV